MEENPVILEPGMVMSDEPAMYRPGEYGIRTENMILIREDSETEFGKFLGFETLTLCYIDTKLVIPDGVRLGKPTSERGREGLVKRENGRNLINGQLTMDNWFAVVLLKLSIVNY